MQGGNYQVLLAFPARHVLLVSSPLPELGGSAEKSIEMV